MNERLLYRIEEAGQVLSLSPPIIRRMIKAGDLTVVRIGGAVRVTAESVKDYIANNLTSQKDA